MTRIAWWMVESLSRLLDDDEREVVRGDLAECGTSAAHALREVIGLVIRRQAVLWCDWRPWFVMASVVIPIGLLLSYASRSWGVTSATRHLDLLALLGFLVPRSPGLATRRH